MTTGRINQVSACRPQLWSNETNSPPQQSQRASAQEVRSKNERAPTIEPMHQCVTYPFQIQANCPSRKCILWQSKPGFDSSSAARCTLYYVPMGYTHASCNLSLKSVSHSRTPWASNPAVIPTPSLEGCSSVNTRLSLTTSYINEWDTKNDIDFSKSQ